MNSIVYKAAIKFGSLLYLRKKETTMERLKMKGRGRKEGDRFCKLIMHNKKG